MTVELGRVGPGWEGRGGAAEAEKALTVRGGLRTVGLTGVAPALASGAHLESESVSSCTRCSGSSGSGEVSWACALRAGQRSVGVPPGWGQRWLSAPALWEPRPAGWVSDSYQVGNLPAFQKFPSGWDWLYRPH